MGLQCIYPRPVMCQRNPRGDWEYQLEGGDSVKLTVNPLDNVFNWVVTCSIPQGNTMESKLEMDADAGFTLVEFNCSNNETAKNAEVEAGFKKSSHSRNKSHSRKSHQQHSCWEIFLHSQS